MTKREQEILDYIKTNPLITQQELADTLGIERSSVAVHISNLSKKGIIKGKGYIIEPDHYVLVIGGSNMDILGSPHDKLIQEDSNPGSISTSPGGVGRNISENLAYLGCETKLLSAVGKDVYGEQLISHTLKAGVDTHYVKRLMTKSTSIYMSILDENKDMTVAVSDMDITKEIDIPYIRNHEDLIKNASFVVFDTNLEEAVINHLLTEFSQTKFIADTVSVTKAAKLKYSLSELHCIKANLKEASILIDRHLESDEDYENALKTFKSRGVDFPMISLGSKGIVYLDDGKMVYQKPLPTKVVNTNGAGDAFTAGITYGFYHNMSIKDVVAYGNAAASVALSSKNTVNNQLSINTLKTYLKGDNNE